MNTVEWVRQNCKFAALPPPPIPPWKQNAAPAAGAAKPPMSTGTPGTAPAPVSKEWKPNYGAWGPEKALRDRLKRIQPDQMMSGMFEAALKRGIEAADKFLKQYEGQGQGGQVGRV